MKHLKAAILFSSALAALALINGCNLAPAYHQPAVAAPPAFKENNGWRLAQPSDGAIKGNWWEVFNDPQLDALEAKVAVSNQNVVGALENFLAARALVKEAQASYYPTVGVDPGISRSRSSTSVHVASSVAQNPTYTTYSLPADASWEPDLWGTVRNTVRANTYTAQAAAAVYENMKLTAQAEVAMDYYQLRGQDELIRLYTDTVMAYSNTLDLTTTLYKTGIYSQLNEVQADAVLQTTIAQAVALEIQRAQYEHAIAMLIGQPASTFSITPATNRIQPPDIPIGVPSALLERRPDVASAERTVAAANAQIGVARAAYFPTLSVSGTVGYQSTSLSSLISPPSFFWSVGGDLAETVFDAGKRKAANQQAWASYRSTVASYRQTVLTAYQQVEDDLASLRILATETGREDIAVQASQKSLDLSLDQFRLGIASYLNVVAAQATLLGNQQTAVSIKTQQLTSSVQLILALGGGWTNADLPSPSKLVLKNPPDGK